MEKIKILVVDDESRMRKLVRDFLVMDIFLLVMNGRIFLWVDIGILQHQKM